MKFTLIAFFLLGSILIAECYNYNGYNNYNYPTTTRNRPFCPYRKVSRLINSAGRKQCIRTYGTECCNLVERLIKAESKAAAAASNQTTTPTNDSTTTTATTITTTTANNPTTASATTTTTASRYAYGLRDDDLIVSVGDNLEIDNAVNSPENNTSEAEPVKVLSAIQTNLKDQVTRLLAQIDQTKMLLAKKETEAREQQQQLLQQQLQQQKTPVVNAADILRITNSRLSSMDALKTLKILAYQKINQNLNN